MSAPAAVYRPRNPQSSDYYRCVEDYFETFLGIYDEHFSRQYGFWRPYVERVIYRYLDSSSASRRSSADTSSEPVLDLIGEPEASCRSQPLRLGIPEGFYPGCGGDTLQQGVPRSHPRRRHRYPDLRRFSRIQSTLPHPRHGWLFLW